MTAKPEAGETVLGDYHTHSYHHSVGDTQLVIATQAVATEDGAADDAPYCLRWQITDGNEQQTIAGIKHQDVAIVERHVDDTKHEEHGEDAIHLAR